MTFTSLYRTAQSEYRLVTHWTVRGSNPGKDEIFRTRPDRTWDPTQPPLPWVLGLCRGEKGRSVVLTTHLIPVSVYEWVEVILPPPLRVCIGISWGDLYLLTLKNLN